jgi:hypothetical protein
MNARTEADFRYFSKATAIFSCANAKIGDENPRPELLRVRRSAFVVILHALSQIAS